MENRIKEIKEFAAHYVSNSEKLNERAKGDLDVLQLCVDCIIFGAKWADENPENTFTKPTAVNFFNNVCLMRANQRAFFELARKKELTDEERAHKQDYFKNSASFERIVDDIIEKSQQILKRQGGAAQ